MAITKLSDVVSAASMSAFTQFFNKAYHDNSVFLRSGVAATDPVIAARCAAAGFGGKTVNMPFWGDLTGDEEVLADVSGSADTNLSINNISAGQDVAVITRRAKAFGITDLAVDLAGDDPMGWIASRLGAYWARRDEAKLLSTLKGIFTATTGAGADLVYDISGETGSAAVLGKDTLLWAAQLLGDKKANLTAVAMNSAAETLLTTIDAQSSLYKPSEQGNLASYNGKTLIVDDNLAYDSTTKKAEIYLFGAGAVAMNDCPEKMPFEAGRDALKNGGQDYVVSRHAGICHLRGFKWTSNTCTGATPTNAELETVANWSKVYDNKDIRVVKVIAKLG